MVKVKKETKYPSIKEIKRDWYLIDASLFRLGELASLTANLLIGKHKPNFSRHLDLGDSVAIINAKKIKVSGRKKDEKIYYHHSGYTGNLKKEKLGEILERKPEKIIFLSVKNMLPKNRLQSQRLKRLKIFRKGSTNLKIKFKELKIKK